MVKKQEVRIISRKGLLLIGIVILLVLSFILTMLVGNVSGLCQYKLVRNIKLVSCAPEVPLDYIFQIPR